MSKGTPNTLERLMASTIRVGDCWEWQGTITPKGYGQTSFNGKTVRAHRVFYVLIVGPIPKGAVLDHLCRNRICVNPAHLEPVTDAENVRRGDGLAAQNARKEKCHRGHEFDSSNTLLIAGDRHCRECNRIRYREHKTRKGLVTA